jgi:hypothetical protein
VNPHRLCVIDLIVAIRLLMIPSSISSGAVS